MPALPYPTLISTPEASHAPGPSRTAWTILRTDPRRRGKRQHPLKGELATRSIGGRTLDQWQLEVTGASRIWHAIDDEGRAVSRWTMAQPARDPSFSRARPASFGGLSLVANSFGMRFPRSSSSQHTTGFD